MIVAPLVDAPAEAPTTANQLHAAVATSAATPRNRIAGCSQGRARLSTLAYSFGVDVPCATALRSALVSASIHDW